MAGDPSNAAIAEALDELGRLYKLDGAIVHRVRAYSRGAKSVREAQVSVAALAREGKATELAGIGATLQEKILALAETGTIPALEKLRAKFPTDHLSRAPDAHSSPRLLLPKALELGQALADGLREIGGPGTEVMIAGSARRMADSVKDIDLIAVTRKPVTLAKGLASLPEVEAVSSAGRAGARGRSHSGTKIDLRIAKPAQLGNLLQHFTGSGNHNAALREAAVRKGLHVSEYGIANDETGATTMCASEEEVYSLLGLAYIEPELREDRGELAAAAFDFQRASGDAPSAKAGEGLPKLIELEDIKGDLHCHTVASDGHHTIEEMALGARERGYEYVAITDHSASHGFGNDVSAAQLEEQIGRVREVNAALEGIEVLAGSEVNILPDGSLDYEDELLAELDWVIASVHTSFRMGEQKMTERMIAAVEHPSVDAIGHPTGRLIERREPYEVDVGALIEAAAKTGTMLEINANPDRRDLNEVHARAAAKAGATLLIDSDAHWV
ncbi:MAG: PHP domain-containing protein, partial [Solirubrobacteraceae bacterium]